MKLVIAEKPSVAMEIGKVLGATQKENSCLKGNGYIINWCYGHLVGLAQPSVYNEKYQKWKIEDLPIIPENYKLVVNDETKEHFYYLKNLMNSDYITEIICATDSGREGELIFRLVYEKADCKKPVKRLWVSSLTEESIKNGFKNLKNSIEYDNLYYAGKYRAIADWLVGLNATRYASVSYGNKITVGRVQTPTLNIIVEREYKIKKFKKEKYYEVCILQEDLGLVAKVPQKINSLDEASVIFEMIKSYPLICNDYTVTQRTKSPTKLYDLTSLQREANKILGYTANETLNILQGLYEKKIVTYPRTDSNYISDDMEQETKDIVTLLYKKFDFLNSLEPICNINQVINNDKVTDHHAILPTKLINDLDFSTLKEKEQNILSLIIKSLLKATNNKCIYEDIEGTLKSNEILLEFSYEKIVEKGYLEIEEKFTNKYKNDIEYPILEKGQIIKNFETILNTKETTPPKRFTEDTLLSAMENAGNEDYKEFDVEDIEKKGLGTPATRASIIEKLINVGYVERKNKNLVPTEKGINAINIVDEKIKSPLTTVEWEVKLQNIEKGNYDKNKFLNEIIDFTKSIVDNKNINTNIREQMVNLNEKSKKEIEKEIIGICPCCNNNIYEADKNFYCSNKECNFTLFKEDKFFKDKKVKLTKTKAKQLLKNKVVEFDKLYSEKTNKFYKAKVMFEVSGKYVNYKLIF